MVILWISRILTFDQKPLTQLPELRQKLQCIVLTCSRKRIVIIVIIIILNVIIIIIIIIIIIMVCSSIRECIIK